MSVSFAKQNMEGSLHGKVGVLHKEKREGRFVQQRELKFSIVSFPWLAKIGHTRKKITNYPKAKAMLQTRISQVVPYPVLAYLSLACT